MVLLATVCPSYVQHLVMWSSHLECFQLTLGSMFGCT
jgi:hypothetical protein